MSANLKLTSMKSAENTNWCWRQDLSRVINQWLPVLFHKNLQKTKSILVFVGKRLWQASSSFFNTNLRLAFHLPKISSTMISAGRCSTFSSSSARIKENKYLFTLFVQSVTGIKMNRHEDVDKCFKLQTTVKIRLWIETEKVKKLDTPFQPLHLIFFLTLHPTNSTTPSQSPYSN